MTMTASALVPRLQPQEDEPEGERAFLERRMRDLFRASEQQSERAGRLAGEGYRLTGAARHAAAEAVALEKEAAAIFWLLKSLDTSLRAINLGSGLDLPPHLAMAALKLQRDDRRQSREHRVLETLRRHATDGIVCASLATIGYSAKLSTSGVRRALGQLEENAAIQRMSYAKNDPGPRFRIMAASHDE